MDFHVHAQALLIAPVPVDDPVFSGHRFALMPLTLMID